MGLPSIINKAQMRRERGLWDAVRFLLMQEYRRERGAQAEIGKLLKEMSAALSASDSGTETTCESTGKGNGDGDG